MGSAELVGDTLSQDTTVWLSQTTDRAAFDPDESDAQFPVGERRT
jgi:hypothetical protein